MDVLARVSPLLRGAVHGDGTVTVLAGVEQFGQLFLFRVFALLLQLLISLSTAAAVLNERIHVPCTCSRDILHFHS